MKRRPALVLLVVAVAGGAAFAWASLRPSTITLTGIVTTNDVFVRPRGGGPIDKLVATEGDTVTKGQLLAVLTPDELKADTAYYAQNAAGVSSQVRESEAALRFEQSTLEQQTAQAESTLAAAEADVQAAAADLAAAKATYVRTQ